MEAKDNASSLIPSSDAPTVPIAASRTQDWNRQAKYASTVEQKATDQMNAQSQKGEEKKQQKTKMVKSRFQ